MNVLFALFAAIVVNGDFENGAGADMPGWNLGKSSQKVWRIEPGAGLNGNRGLVWENSDPELYVYPKQEVKLEPGKRYRIQAQISTRIVKNPAGSKGAGVFIEWYDGDGKYLGSCYPPRVRGTTDWASVDSVMNAPLPGNAARCYVGAFVRKGSTGYAAFDEISVTEYKVKPLGGLFSSVYRDVAVDGKVKFFAPFFVSTNSFKASDWSVAFRYTAADGSRKTVPSGSVTPSFVSFEIDVAELAMGRQNIVCSAASADGKIKDEASLSFERAFELPKRKVYVDAKRRVIVDGKPFFPLGLFSSVLRPPVVDAYSKGPFNCILPYHSPTEKQMDNCHAHGIKVIYALNKTYAGWRAAPKGVKTEADEIKWIEGRMKYAKGHPAMLAWYLADELAVSYVPRLAKRTAWLASVDPDHPTFACYNRIDQLREYLPSVDVFSTDIYPVPHKPLRECADKSVVTYNSLFGSRSMWQTPQVFSWGAARSTGDGGGRFPTRLELRSMCWQMVAGGANGILGYCLHHIMDRNTGEPIKNYWDDACAVFEDLKKFSPVFLSGGEEPKVLEVPRSLAVRTFREGCNIWVLVCNLENAVTKAAFTVDVSAADAEVVYGGGVSYSGKGEFKTDISPYDVCVINLKEDR